MVFLSVELGYMPYVQSWLPKFEQMSPVLQAHLLKLFEEKLPVGITFVREHCKEPIPTVDIQIASSLCSLFEALFTSDNGVDLSDPLEDLKLVVELVFAFSFAWAVGGALDSDSSKQFSKLCMEQFVNVRPPVSFLDSYVDIREKSWKSWDSIVPSFEFDAKQPYFSMLVPTIDTLRYQTLLDTLLGVEKAVFFTGVSGVGQFFRAAHLTPTPGAPCMLVGISDIGSFGF
jgi:dynein heavy chain